MSDTPKGPPLAPISPPRPSNRERQIIHLSEDEARDVMTRHGCILARLEAGPNNDPDPILAGMSEQLTADAASQLSRQNPGVKYGIFKLARIIEHVPATAETDKT